jgi:hypothetical protein
MLKKLSFCLAAFVIVTTGLFVMNQTAQAVSLANALHPLAGHLTLIALLLFYAAVIAVPVGIWMRIPKALTPPEDGEASPEFPKYVEAIHARLRSNPLLSGAPLASGKDGIEHAFQLLDTQSAELIKRTAATIFVVTAISQNGRLDALMVLAAQSRMIWQITRMYNQRPSIRELIQIYANVAVALFVASELEDLDIAEQVEPVITAAVGSSVVGMIPGATMVASIVTQALLEGAANTYLTLRVGVICQNYCKSVLTPFDARKARRQASLKAASLLGSIVAASSGKVVKAIVDASKKAAGSTVQGAVAKLRDAGANLNPFARPGGF